jgi:hypothetical protein
MDNASIKQLVQELRAIRIRELEVLDAIDRSLPSVPPESSSNTAVTTAFNDGPPSVSNRRESIDITESPPSTYSVGDRIEITNKVRRLFNRTPTRRDRIGTVTRVTEKKVEFVTDNGTSTWRAPHNLKRIDA